jgi:hypothetical protein
MSMGLLPIVKDEYIFVIWGVTLFGLLNLLGMD